MSRSSRTTLFRSKSEPGAAGAAEEAADRGAAFGWSAASRCGAGAADFPGSFAGFAGGATVAGLFEDPPKRAKASSPPAVKPKEHHTPEDRDAVNRLIAKQAENKG